MDKVEIVGWVHEIRDLGGLLFFLIRDRTGLIQVTIPKKKVSSSVHDIMKNVNRESVVRIQGSVKAIDKAPGGRELIPDYVELLNTSETPLPLDVVEKVGAELDTRLDARFLDLRRPRVTSVFLIRSAIIQAITDFYFHVDLFISPLQRLLPLLLRVVLIFFPSHTLREKHFSTRVLSYTNR
jgi:aspartyl-tRNA synthetase